MHLSPPYRHKTYEPGVKERLAERSLDGSGMRDVSQVLGARTNLVVNTSEER
jgi:hypothetical protein